MDEIPMKKRVLILGSTGSIGTATLEVIANDPAAFDVCGLACRNNIGLLNEQIARFKPPVVCVFDEGQRGAVTDRKSTRLNSSHT
jgi:1-deoxy-D-xylulose-5-phosphate reductoisomerase